MPKEFSLLRTARVRELPVALAHSLAVAKLGDTDRQALLGRVFRTLGIGDQIRCSRELRACKAAQRGHTLAVVA